MFYLYKAGLLNRPKRGQYFITEEGKTVIEKGLPEINVKFLNNYETFRQFLSLKHDEEGENGKEKSIENAENPEEALERNYERYKSTIIPDLVNKVRVVDPTDFEVLIINLLSKMGYGVGQKGVLHLGKTGNGGVDGEISQDALGLDKIYH